MQLDAAMAEIAGPRHAGLRVHDLRRTFASGLAELGIALPVIEKLLNHVFRLVRRRRRHLSKI